VAASLSGIDSVSPPTRSLRYDEPRCVMRPGEAAIVQDKTNSKFYDGICVEFAHCIRDKP
jgi:hypothetical protein